MKDMIPKGTGNSRFLRSVSNFKAIYPTYDDFVNALVAGTLPVDFNGINEAGVQQVGTALNKANLLTDEVAQKMGLAMADPRPIDMFGVLADAGNIHVWAFVDSSGNKDFRVSVNRNAYQEGTSGGTTITYLGKLGDKARIEVGSYVGTGTYGASNKNTLSFGFEPKLVILENATGYSGMMLNGIDYARIQYLPHTHSAFVLSWSGNTLSWYCTKAYYANGTGAESNTSTNNVSAAYQYNKSGETYRYVAIG